MSAANSSRESDLISVSEAIAIIDAAAVEPRVVSVKLEDAQGLRLARDVVADRDYPPFDKSLMDGFAVRIQDVARTPVNLRVAGEVAAGKAAAAPLGVGEAIAIMTGAPIPQGADGVVPVEETAVDGETVRILSAGEFQRFITPRGADCLAGSIVLPRGTRLEAAQLAVAASVGAAKLDVYARPRVAVLSTGDELVEVNTSPGPAQIRNSNNLMLAGLLRRFECEVTILGIARDEPHIIHDAIARGLQFDALFVTGGMSMGRYDYVPQTLKELGVELMVTKLRIKPGKPFVFGIHKRPSGADVRAGNSYVFGLPGNPVSSFVCALRLASRLILRMSGASELERRTMARLASPLPENGSREFYQPAKLVDGSVQPLKWKGSADIYTLAMANALIVRAEHAPAIDAGEWVSVLEVPQ